MQIDLASFPLLSPAHLGAVLSVLYAQLGVLLLGYCFYRRVRDLRGSLAAESAGRTALSHNLDSALARFERRLADFEQTLAARRAGKRRNRIGGLKRRRALALLAEGRGILETASEANLGPAEVRLLRSLSPNPPNAQAARSP